MRLFFDCEFVEDGSTIDLLSIAVVREDGETYYAVNTEADWAKAKAHPFVSEHVLPHIRRVPNDRWLTRQQIAGDLVSFAGEEPEWWADFAAYDWVALCQLYGTMMDLPTGWPMFCRDSQQFRAMLGWPDFPNTHQEEHDALADAKECKARFDALRERWIASAYHPAAMPSLGGG